jgi:hypothetical protein
MQSEHQRNDVPILKIPMSEQLNVGQMSSFF